MAGFFMIGDIELESVDNKFWVFQQKSEKYCVKF